MVSLFLFRIQKGEFNILVSPKQRKMQHRKHLLVHFKIYFQNNQVIEGVNRYYFDCMNFNKNGQCYSGMDILTSVFFKKKQ